jgi:hypothetical protein
VRLTREQVAHLPMQEFTALWKVRLPTTSDPEATSTFIRPSACSLFNVVDLLTPGTGHQAEPLVPCCRSTSMRMRTAWCGPMATPSRRTASGWCAGLDIIALLSCPRVPLAYLILRSRQCV